MACLLGACALLDGGLARALVEHHQPTLLQLLQLLQPGFLRPAFHTFRSMATRSAP